jgi:hypothetical protein
MKIFLKIIGFLAAIIGILITVFAIFISSMVSETCGNTISSTVPSPTQEWKIVTYSRSCGATSGFSTHISVLKTNQSLPNEGGNAFSAYSEQGRASINEAGLIRIESEWLNEKTILVKYDSMATVDEQDDRVNGITIEYKRVNKSS